jgi:peptidylprolyl isomerase
MRSLRLLAPLVALVLAACLDTTDPDVQAEPTDPATVTFAPALGVNLAAMTRTASGLYYQDLVVGTGPVVAPGDSVRANYQGYLSGGARFDASTPGNPLQSRITSLIDGFREGVTGMAPGGRRKLVIPPLLGYRLQTVRDNSGQVVIPANSVLVFDVELLARYP